MVSGEKDIISVIHGIPLVKKINCHKSTAHGKWNNFGVS